MTVLREKKTAELRAGAVLAVVAAPCLALENGRIVVGTIEG